MNVLLNSTISVFIFAFYVQFNPNIGNIWIRTDSTGKKKLFIQGLLSLMKEPFRNNTFWKIHNWDLNWIIYLIITNYLLSFF